jgi:hypothetical protein
MDRDRAALEIQSMAVADQIKAFLRHVGRLQADRDPADNDVRSSPPSEARAARLRAMRLSWERRGRPWDEQAALRMLAELETRGETRAYGPGGTTYR